MVIGSNAAITIAFFAATASVVWSAAFAWAKWLARPRQPDVRTADVERRLRAVEVAVEAVAIEVERIGEAQRFATRVIGERLPATPVALPPGGENAGGRQVTPH